MKSPLATILLVSDAGPRRDEDAAALTACGLRTFRVDDVAGAMEVLQRDPAAITLVVADLDVEPIGGFNLARAIHRRWSALPVAVVTHEATRALAIQALSAGVVLLPRPVEPERLAQAIVKLLAPGGLAFSLAVLSETGTSFVPFADGT